MMPSLIQEARARGPHGPGTPDEQFRRVLRARLRLFGILVLACLLMLPILSIVASLIEAIDTTTTSFVHLNHVHLSRKDQNWISAGIFVFVCMCAFFPIWGTPLMRRFIHKPVSKFLKKGGEMIGNRSRVFISLQGYILAISTIILFSNRVVDVKFLLTCLIVVSFINALVMIGLIGRSQRLEHELAIEKRERELDQLRRRLDDTYDNEPRHRRQVTKRR